MKHILASRAYARKSREKKFTYLDNLAKSRKLLTKDNSRLMLENEKLRQHVILLTTKTQQVTKQLTQSEPSPDLYRLSSQEDRELSVMQRTTMMLDRAPRTRSNINALDQIARMEGNSNAFDSGTYNTRDNHISNISANHQGRCFKDNYCAPHFNPLSRPPTLVPDGYRLRANGTQQFQDLNLGNDTLPPKFESYSHLWGKSQLINNPSAAYSHLPHNDYI